MAREHVLQPLLLDHVERGLEAVEVRDRRRAAEAHLAAVFDHRAPVPVAARVARRLGRLPGARVDRREGHPRRQHEALLRAADHQVHAPLVHAEVVRGERRDRVHQIERRMTHAVHRRAHLGHRVAHAGRGLVLRRACTALIACPWRRPRGARPPPPDRPRAARAWPPPRPPARTGAPCSPSSRRSSPVWGTSTLSPGEKRFAMLASHAPWPEAA